MVFPQTALAIGVVDSSPNSFSYGGSYFKLGGVRVRRFCGFILSSGLCSGQGSQIQDRAVVTQGVIEAVIWCV